MIFKEVNDVKRGSVIYSKIYNLWKRIFCRCYSKGNDKNKCYSDTTVCEEWFVFSNFVSWYKKNYPYKLEVEGIKLELDKDLLSSENKKIYSPETCVFLPSKINSFLTNCSMKNKSGYTGVCWHKASKKWVAQINIFNTDKEMFIGYFDSKEEAYAAYKKQRKKQAQKAKVYMKKLGYAEELVKLIK